MNDDRNGECGKSEKKAGIYKVHLAKDNDSEFLKHT